AAVVVAGLPGAVHGGLDAPQVVRTPVVDRAGQPLLRRELLRVGVVADPRDADGLGVLAGRRAVDVLAEHVCARGLQARRRVLLGGRRGRVLVAGRRGEDDLVAVGRGPVEHRRALRPFGDVPLEGRDALAAGRLLGVEPALVVCLRPAAVVVWADVDPGGL